MSLVQLKQEVASLPANEQGELMSFIAAIQMENDAEFRAELTQKLDDPDSSRWISLEDAQKRWEN